MAVSNTKPVCFESNISWHGGNPFTRGRVQSLFIQAADSFAAFKVVQSEHHFGLATCEDLTAAHAEAKEAKQRLYEAMGWE